MGGGGARGFAHVGVLEALYKRDIPVAGVVGTSSGSIAAAGYCLGYDPREMRERVEEFTRSSLASHAKVRALVDDDGEREWRGLPGRLFRLFCQGSMVKSLLFQTSVIHRHYFRTVVDFFLPEAQIEDMPIPFAAVATDVNSGQAVVLDHGSLRKAVLASCSVPGVTAPVEIEGRQLIDGGVVCIVPSDIARSLWPTKPLLAVCVDREIGFEEPPSQALECYIRAGEIQSARLAELSMAMADISIYPKVGDFHWADFVRAGAIMDQGFAAVEERGDEIAALVPSGLSAWWQRLRAGRRFLG